MNRDPESNRHTRENKENREKANSSRYYSCLVPRFTVKKAIKWFMICLLTFAD